MHSRADCGVSSARRPLSWFWARAASLSFACGDEIASDDSQRRDAGKLVVQMKDGNRETFCAGDAFHIPPGHDAFVEGDEEVWIIAPRGTIHCSQRGLLTHVDSPSSQVEFIEFDHKNS